MERTADNKAALTLTVSGAANASTSTKKVYVTVDDSALNIAQADVKTTENASALVKAVTGSIEGVAMNSANSGDKENLVVNELKLVLESDFMVNPYIVMNNCDRKARIDEWSRRVKLDDQKIRKNRERRRREQLKKQNQ